MLKKAISILLFFTIIQIIAVSCYRQSQKCKGTFTNARCLIGNGLPYPYFSNYKDTMIQILHFDSLTIMNGLDGETFDCYYAQIKSLFIKSAYAYKPAPPQITIIDRLDSIHFFTLRDYDLSHLAGNSIDDILYHTMGNGNNWTGNGIPTTSLVSEYNTLLNKSQSYTSIAHYSRFSTKPNFNNDTVQIAIQYHLSNGNILGDTSQKFILHY